MKEKLGGVPKPEMPQINPATGISKDFINHFAYLMTLYDYQGIPMIQNHLKERPFQARQYADMYANFRDVITDKNRATVARLDELMLNLETILQNPKEINEEAFKATINEACLLIYGDDQIKI